MDGSLPEKLKRKETRASFLVRQPSKPHYAASDRRTAPRCIHSVRVDRQTRDRLTVEWTKEEEVVTGCIGWSDEAVISIAISLDGRQRSGIRNFAMVLVLS